MTDTAQYISEAYIGNAISGVRTRQCSAYIDVYRRLSVVRLSGVPLTDAVLLFQTLTTSNQQDIKVKDFTAMCDSIGARQIDGEFGFIKSPDSDIPFMLLISSDSVERYCVNLRLVYPSEAAAYKSIADSIRYQFGLNMLLAL